jgi:putative acetyltransferase
VLIAELQGHIIAFSRRRGEELEALYVHPARTGRRIGQLLLRATEKSASARRIHTLYLDAALNAVRFYESAGYQVLGPSLPVFDNGAALPCLRMRKHLKMAARRWCQPRDGSIQPATSASASPSSLSSVLSRRIL